MTLSDRLSERRRWELISRPASLDTGFMGVGAKIMITPGHARRASGGVKTADITM